MNFDQIKEESNDSAERNRIRKTDRNRSINDINETIMDLLNPLKQINLSSGFHSFYNFTEMKRQVEQLLRTQSNIIFYILHQNFMVDDAHKDFFKNMVGRFYDLPERFWSYYQGKEYRISNNFSTILKLVLTENLHFYKKFQDNNNAFHKFKFSVKEGTSVNTTNIRFNKLALEEYWGGLFNDANCAYFAPYNKVKITDRDIASTRKWEAISFDQDYEFGRTNPNSFLIKMKSEELKNNFWFIASFDWIGNLGNEENIKAGLNSKAVYASLGLEKFDEIVNAFKVRCEVLQIDWDDSWIPEFDKNEMKVIRSLSQTFSWTKEYIFRNEDSLDLDVLGLNMSIPWDMELVKYFIEKGYGNRLSENKAVYDKVFKTILIDEIVEKLFRCEYDPY